MHLYLNLQNIKLQETSISEGNQPKTQNKYMRLLERTSLSSSYYVKTTQKQIVENHAI